ncbi:DrmB family protein [uncultured Megasphaera sp.]|uniref:DrmB family protein n=1 Tax=uncultured Megasphaera sp. TaxID=165188 RepID=UPI0025FBF043|nr:DrmB family protein [uncultured Megasphaera sp.]
MKKIDDSRNVERKNLDKKKYSVRANQLVHQFGVGAMINFSDQVLMCAAPEYWESDVTPIHDKRLEDRLGVKYFGLPTENEDDDGWHRMAYVRFPQWYYCPKCKRLQPMDAWVRDYRLKASDSEKDRDPYMLKNPHCPSCGKQYRLVLSRLVTICEHGHINDFPWIAWAHKRSKKKICDHPKLKLITMGTGRYGFDNILVKCENCGASSTLSGIMDKDLFEKLDDAEDPEFLCPGNHPWKHTKEACICYPRVTLRGASSVYFPVVKTSLVIPPFTTDLNEMIQKTDAYTRGFHNLSKAKEKNRGEERLREIIEDTSEEIVEELSQRVKECDVKRLLEENWIDSTENINEDIDEDQRFCEEEYEALDGEATNANESNFFKREEQNIVPYQKMIPSLKQVVLIHKMREVLALIGFSRINPVSGPSDKEQFVCIKETSTDWYPGYQVLGEGIFIRFDEEQIERWIRQNEPALNSRAATINHNYAQSFYATGRPRQITVKFLFLHSLAHALIRQLSFECGYSIASLRERIYCDKGDGSGKTMTGILIYTASGDSEGTLGGLVRQGYKETLPDIIKKAVEKVGYCTNDPVCSLSKGQGIYSMNLAACHSCLLLPETSCENFNAFLDRGVLIGTMEEPDIGFFSKGFDTYL